MLKVDKLFIAWALIGVICGVIRDFRAQQLGNAYDALGIYFLVRILTKEPEDVLAPLRLLGLLSLVVSVIMCFEAASHRNPFAVMGGVPIVDEIRNGKARAQGPFQNSLTAGIFGATLFPLMIGLWLHGGNNRRAAIAGIVGCVFITVASVSSGALMTIGAACIGLCLWRARNRMRLFRWAVVIIVVSLNMVMKVPVWWLIARVSDLVGGSGWYRSWLIDVTVHHFSKWWLMGDYFTANWAPQMFTSVGDRENLDITNYYVAQCIMGGIWMLVAFIAIFTCCFQIVGRLVHSEEHLIWKRTFIWTFGAALGAYSTTFISMNVYVQSGVFWHWLLAVVAALPAIVRSPEAAGGLAMEPASDDLTRPPDNATEPFYSPYLPRRPGSFNSRSR
jgi:hypothetical protein